MRALFRAFDHEVRAGQVGGQGAGGTQGIKSLFDQGAKLGFHNGHVVTINGVALYASRRAGLNGSSQTKCPVDQTIPRAAIDTGAPSPITK